MRSARVWAIAGSVLMAATAAEAADMPVPPPPMPEAFATWYLRGDIGITNQTVSRLENELIPASTNHVNAQFDASGLFGLGIGMNVNNWLRVDVTGEYRGNSDFSGLDIITSGGSTYTDEYRAKKSEWLFLANAYLDLGTWWCVTPFIGAGIGASRVTISSFTDVNTVNHGVSFAPTASKWNFAWALHAGLAYQVSNNLAIEFAYRYTHLGDGVTGDVVTYNGINDFYNPVTFKDINSHDVKLGVRFVCCDVPPPPPPPLIAKG